MCPNYFKVAVSTSWWCLLYSPFSLQAGLWIRWGGQDALSEVLTQEARDIAFLTGTEDQDYEAAVEKVTVPMSQLVHFYSPLAWAKLVKLEYEGAEGDEKLNGGDDDENDDANQFAPGEESLSLRKFEIAYSADVADIKAEINVSYVIKGKKIWHQVGKTFIV